MSRVDMDAPSILVWTEESEMEEEGGGAEATVSSALPRTFSRDMHDRGQDSSPTFYCKALYDYSSTDPSSLSFRAGDIIEVLTTLTSGWWDGLLDGETRGWFPSTFTTTISRDDAERALHSRHVRPSVSDSEALVSLGPFSPGDSASDWLADEMSYGLGRESFNDLANSSFDQPSKGHQQQNDFWMPEVGDDGQIYYVNSQTGARSRDLPSDDMNQTPTSATSRGLLNAVDARAGLGGHSKRTGTPEPWVKRMGDAGVYYYENLLDGSVRWTPPSPVSTPRVQAKLQHQQEQQPTPRLAVDERPLSFVDPQFSSSLSFIDDQDEVDFDDIEENDAFMNRLSVYSDDSDALPRSPAVEHFPGEPALTPQQILDADLRHAEELQSHLIIPAPRTLDELCEAVKSAIGLVEQAVARKSQQSQSGQDSNWNERAESLNPADAETVHMVASVRDLLYSFSFAPLAAAASGDQPQQPVELPILKPHQRKVAATLSKLILSLRSLHIQSEWPENTETIQADAREMRNVIQAFVDELARATPVEARQLQGALVSGRGLAGIGLGSMGAGSAGRWTGNGFVDSANFPAAELDDSVLPRLQECQAEVAEMLSKLAEAASSNDVDLTTTARQALKSLTAFSEFVANINVTKMDVDGHQDGHRLSKADAEAYANSVAQGRVLVRNLEAALQMVMDDSSALLGVCQNARDLQTGLPKTLSSLTLGVDLACQTLRGMVQVVSTQKSISTPRRFSAASLRLPHARKSSAPRIEPIPTPTHAGIQEHNPRLPLPPPINIEPVQPQASGSRHHAASNASMMTSPSMIVSPETATDGGDDQDDDMVDMELAFSRGPARPRAPSDFDATALFYGAPPKDDSRESDSPEPGDRASEEFSQHSRTTSQPTTLGSMGPPSSSVPENESNSALPLKDMSKLDIDDDDEDLTSTKSSRKRAPKIKQFFGDDAPQYMLNQLKESPAYLRPDYAPSDIIIHPDGSVRAGTLPALIEHLTMHDFRDALFFNSFLTTFKTFATADDVVDQLIKRFHLRPPEGLDDDQMRDWKEQKQTVVRIRVINTFKSMLGDEDVMSKDDVDALETIEDFAADAQRVSPPAKQLLSLVERVRRGGNQSVIKMTANMTLNPPPAIYPKNSKKMKLLDIDPLELARQMTIMESKLFCTIRASECLQRSQASTGDRSDNIRNIIVTSNKIADWVADSILANEDHRKRGALIKLFITAAERCRSLQNFSTMAAFIAGLNSPPIRRLKRSWESVGKSLVATFDSVEKTLDSGRSFQNYKATLSKVDPPCVPFLGVYLTTLTFIQDGSPDTLKEGNLINFNKRHKIAEVIREMKTFQAKPYNLTPIPYVLSFIEDSISSLKMSADDFWNLSLVREPREKDDEKMQRLLTESGFL